MTVLHILLFSLLSTLAQSTVVITYDTSVNCGGALYRTFPINPGNCVTFPAGYLAASAIIADHRPLPLRLRVWTWQGTNMCAVPDGTGASSGSCVTTTYQNRVISGISLVNAPGSLVKLDESLPLDHHYSVHPAVTATPLTYGYLDGQTVYKLSAESQYGEEYAKLQDTQDKISFLMKHGDKHPRTAVFGAGDSSQIELK